jgi:dihydrofolate reductase
MSVWETMPTEGEPAVVADYAEIWRAAEKIIFSRTLGVASTTRTRIERTFDAASVRRLKASSSRDISIGGPHLAAHAFEAGLVDRVRQFLSPVVVGGGTRFLPDGVAAQLDLVDEFRFANGVVYLDYRVRPR